MQIASEHMQKLLVLLKSKRRSWGYLLSEFCTDQSRFVLAFPDARSAVAWALRFVKDLATVKVKPQLSTWYLEALQPPEEDYLCDPESQVLFQGMLPAIGMHTAPCKNAVLERVKRHRVIRYQGHIAEISNAVALMAAPGQVCSMHARLVTLSGSNHGAFSSFRCDACLLVLVVYVCVTGAVCLHLPEIILNIFPC